MAGDAAGMTDAISGAGIISGILAGKLAAKVTSGAVVEDNTSKGKLLIRRIRLIENRKK